MKSDSKVMHTIVPAHPGYVTVFAQDNAYELGEDVIAWRIETHELDTPHGPELMSYTYPITVEGSPPDNWAGVRQPDGQVILPHKVTYISLEEANKDVAKNLPLGRD